MKHNYIKIPYIPISALDGIDASCYDKPYTFSNKENTLALTVTHTNSGNKHIPVHRFMPYGWGLDSPLLRQYNLYLQKNYHGDIYFYSLRHIKLVGLDKDKSTLEQIARMWLEAQIDQNIVKPNKLVLIEGISIGGTLASVVASMAHEYNITIGNLNVFEPAGMTKKNARTMLKQVTDDTRQDYIDAFGSSIEIQKTKAKMLLATIRNIRVQRRVIQEISSGNLAMYINKYLETQNGEVHIGHGAKSTFITFDDLDNFSDQLIAPDRVQSFDYEGVPHGFGGKVLGLSDWYGRHTAIHQ